jgi:putative nucleotidyltransferase with HDIG domain
MSGITSSAKNYIRILTVSSIAFTIFLTIYFPVYNWKMVSVFIILAIISETFMVKLPGIGGVSVAFAITFATIIEGGPLSGVIVSALGIALSRPYVEDIGYIHIFNTPLYKTLFNISQNILYTGLAGLVYVFLHNRFIYLGEIEPISVMGSMLTFLVVNTFFMTLLIITLNGGRFLDIWYENFRGIILSVTAVGLLGIIIAVAYEKYGAGAVVLFFIPLMLSRYSFKLYVDMRKNYYDTVKALINTIEAKDSYTSGHAARVGEYAVAIATEMNMSLKQVDRIRNAALLHDIGKIGINDNILNKEEKLSDLEFEVIKRHPSIGYDIISDIGFLSDVMSIVRNHHERWDGKGYPDGLKGEEISLETCVLTIADSFDAMTTDRPYRKALTVEEALDEIRKNSGTQFNPDIVEISVKVLKGYGTSIEKDNKDKGIA